MEIIDVKAEWDDWLAEPDQASVRALGHRFPPWTVWRLKPTGQIVVVASFYEDQTLNVYVEPRLTDPLKISDIFVFGINPDDLEPFDAPRGWQEFPAPTRHVRSYDA